MGRRIYSLEIKNFRQFHDIKLEFKKKDKISDLNIVIGGNRFGKTNLLNAIYWALYGEETEKNTDTNFIKNERYPEEDLVVTLDMENNDGKERIKRSISTGVLLIKRDPITQKDQPSDNPEIDIKNIIPKSVRNFFLFKGEFLDNFFDYQNGNFLKDTILKVSNLEKLKRINDILEMLESDYRNEISKRNRKNKELEKINEKIIEIEEILKNLQKRLIKLESKIRQRKQRVDEINKTLRNFDEKNINLLLEKEENLKLLEDKYNNEIEKLRKNLKNIFLNEISFWFLFPGISSLKKELDMLEKKGLIPPPISQQLIRKIFEEERCICGRKLTHEMRKELENLLENISENKSHLEGLYKLNLSLFADKKDFEVLVSKVKNLLDKKSEYETKLIDIRKNMKHLSEELKNIKSEDVYRLQSEKEVLEEELEDLKTEKIEISVDINDYEIEKQFLEADFNKKSSKIGSTELLNRKLQLSSYLREKLKMIFDELLAKIINELNKKTKECFQEMFWDNIKFIDYEIKLNENFDIEVISPQGNNMINDLATGEKKVLVLSFMTALIDFYGFDFPLVIDAPFTALQKEVKMKVLDTLLNISKQKQVIIFTIRPEKELMEKLTENANKIYELKKDERDNTIVEVIK